MSCIEHLYIIIDIVFSMLTNRNGKITSNYQGVVGGLTIQGLDGRWVLEKPGMKSLF